MDNLPKIEETQPEYLTWSLEKLQEEYHMLKLKHLSLGIRMTDLRHKAEKADTLARILRDLMDEE